MREASGPAGAETGAARSSFQKRAARTRRLEPSSPRAAIQRSPDAGHAATSGASSRPDRATMSCWCPGRMVAAPSSTVPVSTVAPPAAISQDPSAAATPGGSAKRSPASTEQVSSGAATVTVAIAASGVRSRTAPSAWRTGPRRSSTGAPASSGSCTGTKQASSAEPTAGWKPSSDGAAAREKSRASTRLVRVASAKPPIGSPPSRVIATSR